MRNFTGSSWLALAGIALLGSAAFVPTGRAAVHSLPLVLPAGNPDLMGFIRIVNRLGPGRGGATSRAIDDSGNEAGPITLSIGADSSRHFNSEDLEVGNPDKEGLSDGVGGGQCSWRLELETDLDILPLAFVRTVDGFVTSIHDVVPEVEPGAPRRGDIQSREEHDAAEPPAAGQPLGSSTRSWTSRVPTMTASSPKARCSSRCRRAEPARLPPKSSSRAKLTIPAAAR